MAINTVQRDRRLQGLDFRRLGTIMVNWVIGCWDMEVDIVWYRQWSMYQSKHQGHWALWPNNGLFGTVLQSGITTLEQHWKQTLIKVDVFHQNQKINCAVEFVSTQLSSQTKQIPLMICNVCIELSIWAKQKKTSKRTTTLVSNAAVKRLNAAQRRKH